MKVVLAILCLAVAGLVESKPATRKTSKFMRNLDEILPDIGDSGENFPVAWTAFMQLVGKCEAAREMGLDLYDEGFEDYTILGESCPRLARLFTHIEENPDELAEVGAKLEEVLPLLECVVLEAEVEGIEYIRWRHGSTCESRYLNDAYDFLETFCLPVYGSFNAEVAAIENAIGGTGGDPNGALSERNLEAELRKLLLIAAKKTRK